MMYDTVSFTRRNTISCLTPHITRLSGLLFEATENQTYLNAALQSLNFIYAHLYNDQHVVDDTILSDTCQVSQNFALPYNSAFMIEGMSILFSITKNQSTMQLLRTTLAATVYNKAWQKDDGVIAFGSQNSGDRTMVHALLTVYRRNSTAPDLRDYIRDYLTVQYNAMLDSATAGGDIYGLSWIGPPGAQLDPGNQTTALTVLISAITLENTTSSVPPVESGGSSPGSSPAAGGTRPSKVAIVGGSVGGALFLVGLGIGIWWLLHRLDHKADKTLETYNDHQLFPDVTNSDHLVVSPFTEHTKNRSEPIQRKGGTTGLPRSRREENGHFLASMIRPPALPSPHWSNSSMSSTDRGTSSLRELGAELRALRLQNSRLQERTWEEDESPPPEYCSVRSGRREQLIEK
ncbi:hypothetical protein PM082_024883 [Marasmius tenuissimus]|nr:hypothetical protein PM082_024883 [Marasmius tenuissimus]